MRRRWSHAAEARVIGVLRIVLALVLAASVVELVEQRDPGSPVAGAAVAIRTARSGDAMQALIDELQIDTSLISQLVSSFGEVTRALV